MSALPATSITAAPSEAPPAAPPSTPRASPFVPLVGFDGGFVVSGLPPVSRVTLAGSLFCALTRGGEEWCWRDASTSETPEASLVTTMPSRVHAGRISDISSSCALGAGIQCPGLTLNEQPNVEDAVSIAAGVGHACAVRRSGKAVCWGDGSYGQLGTLDTSALSDVPGVRGVVEVSAGRYGSCAVTGAGALVCWGAASFMGWAPGGSGWHAPAPTPPTRLLGIGDVAHVSLRGDFPCLARRNGHVLCWFPDDATTLLPKNPLPPDSPVRGLDDARFLSGQLAIRADKTLAAIDFTFDDKGNTLLSSSKIGGSALEDVIDADGSPARGCAVALDGVAVCWGIETEAPSLTK